MSVRAKFLCTKASSPSPGQTDIELKPVYSDDPEHENKAFWEATPSGKIEMSILNAPAAEAFAAGQEYYVDFSPASPTDDAA
jgi:hypothetical protein